jgi:hypothetical protein
VRINLEMALSEVYFRPFSLYLKAPKSEQLLVSEECKLIAQI